jgi:UDP-N-acetylglucosamine:LPS N-acetylglucosamine transferase
MPDSNNNCVKSTQTNSADLLSKEEEARFYAQKLLYNKDLMVEQYNSWLSEEEGMKNMEKQIKEKKKKSLTQ